MYICTYVCEHACIMYVVLYLCMYNMMYVHHMMCTMYVACLCECTYIHMHDVCMQCLMPDEHTHIGCMYIYVHMYIHVCMRIHTCMYICLNMPGYVHMYIHLYV